MNVIVGIIVDSMGKERDRQREKAIEIKSKDDVTLEKLSAQISDLQKHIEQLEKISRLSWFDDLLQYFYV